MTTAHQPRAMTRDDTHIAKALSHPLRARVLSLLQDRVASTRELSEDLEESLPNVAFHVRALERLGCVERVDTVPRRGTVEYFYRAVCPDSLPELVSDLPLSVRAALSSHAAAQATASLAAALEHHNAGARARGARATLTRLTLDEMAWRELAQLVDQVRQRALSLQGESIERGSGTRTDLTLMLYEPAPAAD